MFVLLLPLAVRIRVIVWVIITVMVRVIVSASFIARVTARVNRGPYRTKQPDRLNCLVLCLTLVFK